MSILTANHLDDEFLKSQVGEVIYRRGLLYYWQKRVELVSLDDYRAHCHVFEAIHYCVDIFLQNGIPRLKCNCEFSRSGLGCEHIVAASLYLRDFLKINQSDRWKEKLSAALIAGNHSKPKRLGQKPYLLFFSLQQEYNNWSIQPVKIMAKTLPDGLWNEGLLRDIETSSNGFESQHQKIISTNSTDPISEIIEHNPWIAEKSQIPQKALDPGACLNASSKTVSIANLLIRTERTYSNAYYYGFSRPIGEYLTLLSGVKSTLFLGDSGQPLKKPLRILSEPGTLGIEMVRTGDGLELHAEVKVGEHVLPVGNEIVRFVNNSPLWVISDTYLYMLSDELSEEFTTQILRSPKIKIPKDNETEFLESYFLPLVNQIDVRGEGIIWEEIDVEPVKRLYLSEKEGELIVQLRFGYEHQEVGYEKPPSTSIIQRKHDDSWTLVRIERYLDKEEEIYRSISTPATGLKYGRSPLEPGSFILRARVDPVDFLIKKIPILTEKGFEIYGEKQLKATRVNRSSPTISLDVSSGIDWFDIQAAIKFGEVEASFEDVRRAVRKKEQYVRLADGSIGEIPDEWIKKYKHLFGLGEKIDRGMRLSTHHVTMIEQLLVEADQSSVDEEYQRRLNRLEDFDRIKSQPLPKSFTGELRPYQKAGYDWLYFLHDFHFGGCLADDMGLGKTIQVLVFLASLKEKNITDSPHLIVVPRSLLTNWQREVERFTPNLRVLEHFGPTRDREQLDLLDCDIVITTYGTMRRDVKMLRRCNFYYVILDESQVIKNPLTQVSKATRLLRSKHRLVLTGTPVENSTYELWAQFAFLNPGLLGNLEYFKREFAHPIERNESEEATRFLKSLIYPFILRRTKRQVAPELPPRTERILFNEMKPKQRKVYNKTREYYRNLLLGLIEEEGFENARMKVLEGLLRLRQISNHPSLFKSDFKGKSAKIDQLFDTLETLYSEGHQALIFSQFVKMLSLVRKEMDNRGFPYLYLDGGTHNRQRLVDEFQENSEIPFFLISLRAGGLGLNLTAADYVIQIDPWWNPAVEKQAADRTHRIGQDKPVIIYKLITRDTVEEKILKLQEQKKALVDQLISPDKSFFKNLTTEDIAVLFS